MPEQLTPDERAVLDFEEAHYRLTGNKEALVRTTFGISSARYHQKLLSIVRKPAAIAEYPQLAKRIQRQAAERAAARAQRKFTT